MELPEFPAESELRNPDSFQRSTGEPAFTAELGDYDDFETLLGDADRRGILDVPAELGEAARAGEANLVREAVIAERLWLLGYLRKQDWVASSRKTRHREAFLDGVAGFQRDAGLVVDGWSGDATWEALQQLITFESKTHVDRYCPGGQPCVALIRALRLRLWALGLLRERPRRKDVHDRVPSGGLTRFWNVWRQFDAARSHSNPPSQETLISLVFDQDQLLENIARVQVKEIDPLDPPVFRRLKTQGETGDASAMHTANFLASVARIELWLLGFSVDIADQRGYPVFGVATGDDRVHPTLKSALAEFWDQVAGDREDDDAGLNAKAANARRRSRERLRDAITPELFIALQDPDRLRQLTVGGGQGLSQADPAEADDYSREITDQLNTDEQVRETWARGKSLGMKLWDGMRRLWRWVKRGIRALLRVGENIVRGFFRYAMKAFEIAKLAAENVVKASQQYLSGQLYESAAVHVHIRKDGDIQVVLQDGVLPAATSAAGASLSRFGAAFELSCRLLALLLRGLRMVTLRITGWARFLWALVRTYRDIRPIYKELRALP